MPGQDLDVAAWLRDLGLERYAPAFRDAEVTPEALPELTDADLRELGLPLGPRKVVLKAIRDLAGLSATRVAAERSRAEAGPSTPSAPPEAERRRLTVMFCDLVGSTALSRRLDPEEMRELIRAYQNAVTGEIARLEGHVAKLMGDGVLAYFGWPRAHEDEAERAVRAGLAVAEAVGRLAAPGGEALAARVGIATGLVVVGDLVGEGAAREEAVTGETPNLAARLQELAGPGQVVVTNETQRLLGRLFDLEGLGPLALKGFAEPVRAWRVSGPGDAEGRFEALRGSALTPLVGREQELGLLLDRWRRAAVGEGQAVLLQGEPGVGKSRLALALRERLRDQPRTRLSYACSPHHTSSALWPVIRQLERAAGLGRDDPPPVRLAKLADLLRQALPEAAEALPLMAELLSIPAGAGYAPPDLTPQQRKARTFEALLAQLEGLAARRPVLMVLEDAHWLDPTTRELFEQVVARIGRLPVLLVVTLRPDVAPPWTGFPHVTLLTLGRLARSEAATLASQTAGGRTLSGEVLDQILARTEGVPLFVEELTKAVLEAGLPGAGDDRPEGGRPPPADVPASLHDTLMARLDRLAPVKEVAQVGAVIGREFPHRLLAAVADLPEDRLEEAAGQLVTAGLVLRRGAGREATYSFKHALVRDAAYQSLLFSRRRLLHGRVAAAIERHFPEMAAASPETLALHLEAGGRALDAAARWQEAAERADLRAAYLEARDYLERALSLVPATGDDPASLRRRLGSLLALANVWRNIEGAPSRAATALSEETLRLAEAVGDDGQRFAARWNAWASHQYLARLAEARRDLGALRRLARDDADGERALLVAHAGWTTHFAIGRLDASARDVERGLGLYDPVRHRAHRFSFGAHDPGVCCRATGGLVAWLRGRPERADVLAEGAVALGVELRHGFSLGIALLYRSILAHYSRRPELVPPLLEDIDRWVGRGELAPYYRLLGDFFRLWAAATRQEDVDLGRLRSAVALLRERQTFRMSYQFALAADTALLGREPLQAWAWLDEAVAFEAATGERFWLAEVHRLRAACATAGVAAAGEPERHLELALGVARDTGARSLELRAAANLARLWAERGERQKAQDLLAPVSGRFTEGFDTPDLAEARTLLDAL